MNERSIFSIVIASWCRRASDECPVPKSSIATRTPRACSASTIASLLSGCSMAVDSVISSMSRPGAIPNDSTMPRTDSIAVRRQKRDGRLTET